MLRSVICLLAFTALTGCDEPPAPAAAATAPNAASPARTAVMLQDADGKTCIPLTADGRKATVLIFLMHDCPVANASAPELARLAAEFTPQGMKFYGVYATETAAEITKHRKDFSLPFPGLLDPKLDLARLAGATRVPEAAVFSPSGELLYRGRIDDRAVEAGITKPVAHQHDLRLGLEAVLAGKQPEPKFTKAIGCYLPVDQVVEQRVDDLHTSAEASRSLNEYFLIPGDSFYKLGPLSSAIQKRIERHNLSPWSSSATELDRVSTWEERAVVRLVAFYCGASNDGRIYTHLSDGLSLLKELEAVGAMTTVTALQELDSIVRGEPREAPEDVLAGHPDLKRIESRVPGDFAWADPILEFVRKNSGRFFLHK